MSRSSFIFCMFDLCVKTEINNHFNCLQFEERTKIKKKRNWDQNYAYTNLFSMRDRRVSKNEIKTITIAVPIRLFFFFSQSENKKRKLYNFSRHMDVESWILYTIWRFRSFARCREYWRTKSVFDAIQYALNKQVCTFTVSSAVHIAAYGL